MLFMLLGLVKKVTSIRTISEVTDVHLGHDELISRFTDSR